MHALAVERLDLRISSTIFAYSTSPIVQSPANATSDALTDRIGSSEDLHFPGDEIEIMRPDGRNTEAAVLAIITEEGEEMESAPHPKQSLWIELSEEAEKYDLLRVKA